MRKKFFAVVAIVVSMGLSACSDKGGGSSSSNPAGPTATTPTPTPSPTITVGSMTFEVVKSGASTYNVYLYGDLNAGLNNPVTMTASRVIRVREWSCAKLTTYTTGYGNSSRNGQTATLIPGILACGKVDVSLQLDAPTIGTSVTLFTFADVKKVTFVPAALAFSPVAGEVHIQGALPQ